MIGTWRWNAGFGVAGGLLTFLFSIGSNPLPTMLLRSLYACLAFFLLAYVARVVLALILHPPGIVGNFDEGTEDAGTQLDFTTPENSEELNDLLKAQLNGESEPEAVYESESLPSKLGNEERQANFKPLNPPQLVSSENKSPEQLADAIRHLTGE